MRALTLCICALAALLMLASPWNHAEAGVEISGENPSGLVLIYELAGGAGSGPDPWPLVRRHVPLSWILNPDGSASVPSDGWPSFVWNDTTQTYEVVWARHDGHDFEIMLAAWDNQLAQWSAPQTLTANTLNDVAPEVTTTPSGALRLAYERAGEIYVRSRPVGSSWAAEELVDVGLKPSVARTQQECVAYQADVGGGSFSIVVAAKSTAWVPVVIASTSFSGFDGIGDLDVRLHATAGKVWVDWESAANELSWSELLPSGSWSAPTPHAISSPDNEERGRREIKQQVLP